MKELTPFVKLKNELRLFLEEYNEYQITTLKSYLDVFTRFKNELLITKGDDRFDEEFFDEIEDSYHSLLTALCDSLNTRRNPGESFLDFVFRCESLTKIELDKATTRKAKVKKIIASFDDNKAINFIDNFCFVLEIMGYSDKKDFLRFTEVSQILGSIVYFNASAKKGNLSEKEKELFNKLKRFYTPEGKFVNAGNLLDFEAAMFNLIENSSFFKHTPILSEVEMDKFSDWIETTGVFATSYYGLFLGLKRENDIKMSVDQVDVSVPKLDYSNQAKLKEYYANGEIIKVADDLDEFKAILDGSLLSGKEAKEVLKQMQTKMLEEKLKGLFNEFDLFVIESAKNYVNVLDVYDFNSIELRRLLGEISTVKDMYLDTLDEDEQLELVSMKDEFIRELNTILNNLTIDVTLPSEEDVLSRKNPRQEK